VPTVIEDRAVPRSGAPSDFAEPVIINEFPINAEPEVAPPVPAMEVNAANQQQVTPFKQAGFVNPTQAQQGNYR